MEFCLHHSLALSAGVFLNAVDTTPDILVWGLDRDRGLLENDVQSRLRGHEGQVYRKEVEPGSLAKCSRRIQTSRGRWIGA